jgi:hypothetical protein
MRKSMLIKIAAVAPVVLTTWLVTSTVVGKVKAYAGDRSAHKKLASQVAITTTTQSSGTRSTCGSCKFTPRVGLALPKQGTAGQALPYLLM